MIETRADEVRDEVIAFLWDHRHWADRSRQDYETLWNWRYRSLGDGEPALWIVRDDATGELVGHLAVFPRWFRLGDQRLRCAVPGDALMHRRYRTSLVGVQLFQNVLRLVRGGTFDFALGFATPTAHRMLKRMGVQELGHLEDHVQLMRSAAILGSGIAGRVLGVVGDPALQVWRALHRRGRRHFSDAKLEVREVEQDDVLGFDRAHWQYPAGRLVGGDSPGYIRRRFFDDPFGSKRTAFALVDPATGRLEAYVIARVLHSRVEVDDCQTNVGVIDVPEAIGVLCEHLRRRRRVAVCVVQTLSATDVGRDLRRTGMLRRRQRGEAPFYIGAYWSPRHPLAAQLANVSQWHLFRGSAEF